MIVISANKLKKAYGTDVVLEDASFAVNDGERIGIIGKNGTGKTTLLNILAGEWEQSEGEFFVSQGIKIGYLKQRDNFFRGDTVIDSIDSIFRELHEIEEDIQKLVNKIESISAAGGIPGGDLIKKLDELHNEYEKKGGFTYKSEMTGVLSSMSFTPSDCEKKIDELSGGEKTRLALAALLLEKPDILLLDEPTNHLDLETLRWLEQYLAAYKGTILIVSHDRYFLDKLVGRIFEVENKKLYTYTGSYSAYAEQRRIRRESELRAYRNQQREIRRQEDMIRMMKGHNTEKLVKRAQSREKRLAMIERLEKPESEGAKMKFRFKEKFKSGNDVLIAEDVGKTLYDRKPYRHLFSNVNMDIKRGEKICIVGPNGSGKTTLLKMILGEKSATEGRFKIGVNVAFGYYDQGQQLLNDSLTVIEELRESYRLYTDTEIRSILGRFLFRGEDVFLNVGSLSGGEKARLNLVKLMLSGANTLILDEPTNHMDIESKEVFEDAIREFPGTCIIVSHDRYFLQKIPTRMLELTENGAVEYLGQYDFYLESKEKREAQMAAPAPEESCDIDGKNASPRDAGDGELSSKEERRAKKQQEAEERRLRREIEKTESEISELEEAIKELEAELSKPDIMTNFTELEEIGRNLSEKKTELNQKYEYWASLH